MVTDDAGPGPGPLRRKTLSAHNSAAMRTVVDCGGAGPLGLGAPVPHGGTGERPTPAPGGRAPRAPQEGPAAAAVPGSGE